jgi:leucyl-tRNA synthetase
VRRFLDRVYASVRDMTADGAPEPAVLRKLHQTIKKVGDDVPRLSYNTAVAAMMAYVNVLRQGERTPHRDETLPLVQLAASFAPHLAEELWERAHAGRPGAGSVFDAGWPQFDAAFAAEELATVAVQVNGKTRGTVQLPRDAAQEQAAAAAMQVEGIAKYVTGPPKKVIFVPGRLLNLVV